MCNMNFEFFSVTSWVFKHLSSSDSETSSTNTGEGEHETAPEAKKKPSRITTFTKEKAKQFATLEQNEKAQFSTYLVEGVLESQLPSSDPLTFWKNKESHCPMLCKVKFYFNYIFLI